MENFSNLPMVSVMGLEEAKYLHLIYFSDQKIDLKKKLIWNFEISIFELIKGFFLVILKNILSCSVNCH